MYNKSTRIHIIGMREKHKASILLRRVATNISEVLNFLTSRCVPHKREYQNRLYLLCLWKFITELGTRGEVRNVALRWKSYAIKFLLQL